MNTKHTLLLIDDAKTMHELIRARLGAEEVDIHSAYDGEQGLAMARQLQPDVILLDVEMPFPNGFEVCRCLKEDANLKHVPVIFLTAMSSTEQKIRGLNSGAIDFVTKPFDAGELQARVRVSLRTKELLDLLNKKAMIDGPTGLWNRGYLNERLVEEMASTRRHRRQLSVMMVDADHFKSINDVYGHGFGDIVLRGIAAVIQDSCRTEDVACRYGGEEFSIILRDTDALAARVVGERIRTAIAANPFTRGTISVNATVSIGIAEWSPIAEDVVERADQALYAAKQAGRNRVVIAPDVLPIAA